MARPQSFRWILFYFPVVRFRVKSIFPRKWEHQRSWIIQCYWDRQTYKKAVHHYNQNEYKYLKKWAHKINEMEKTWKWKDISIARDCCHCTMCINELIIICHLSLVAWNINLYMLKLSVLECILINTQQPRQVQNTSQFDLSKLNNFRWNDFSN